MLGSLEASSASAVCLEFKEVLCWFRDPIQKKDVIDRFVKARSATQRHPDAWARENWVEACKNMRDVMAMEAELSGMAFQMVCTLLEQHSKGLEENPSNRQPCNHQPGGAKAMRQESADQQPSGWPAPRLHVEGEGNALDLAPGTALQGARGPKKRAAPALFRAAMKKPTIEYAAKLRWFQDQVLEILDRNTFMTIRAINKLVKKVDPVNSQNTFKLWGRTNPYPIATACSTRVQQLAYVHGQLEYSFHGSCNICGKDVHFYWPKPSSFGDGSHGTGGGGSEPADDNESGEYESWKEEEEQGDAAAASTPGDAAAASTPGGLSNQNDAGEEADASILELFKDDCSQSRAEHEHFQPQVESGAGAGGDVSGGGATGLHGCTVPSPAAAAKTAAAAPAPAARRRPRD
jgi:hypothetical protein